MLYQRAWLPPPIKPPTFEAQNRGIQMQPKTLITTLTLFLAVTSASYGQAAGSKASQRIGYPRLPLAFEANRGQTSSQAQFLVHSAGYTAFLTTDGLVLSLRTNESNASTQSSLSNSTQTASGSHPLQIKLRGATAKPLAVGEDLQPGVVNYFIGNDPSNWRMKVPTFGQVRYKNIYPGIDLVYHGNHQQLEYDFELRPGSNPNVIAFQVLGANRVGMDKSGNLLLTVGHKALQVQCPVIYQFSKGQKTPVAGSYVMQDSTHIGFSVAQYDRSQALVIDPVLVYATYLGGSSPDVAGGVAIDQSGDLYLTGYTSSSNFPVTNGEGELPPGGNHVFVSKLDPTGSTLIYTDFIGGSSDDYGVGLALDSSNGVFVTGATTSNNFPVVNAFQSSQPGPYTGFMTHISADGSTLLYSTYLGGNAFDQPTGIAVNSSDQVYVAGYTESLNYPVANAYQSTASPNQGQAYGTYGFVTKFNESGSELIYSTFLAGNTNVLQNCGNVNCYPAPYSSVNAITLDANDNAYVVGSTNTYNFPTSYSAYLKTNTTPSNAQIAFVTKLSSAGSLGYSTYFYASSGNPVSLASIAVDNSGSAYITGSAESDGTFPITTTSICDPGVYGYACSYAFVSKFDPSAATLVYSTFLGPNNYATPQTILLDSSDNAYVVSSTTSPDFQAMNPIEAYDSGLDVLLVEINADATAQMFSTYLGGSGDDVPSGMAIDQRENVYIAGSTSSADFPVTPGAFQTQAAGDGDAFLAKIFTGSSPLISFSPTALEFSSQSVGTTSQSQSVQVQNLSVLPLSISSLSVEGDFTATNNCGNTLAANSSCTLAVTFTPTSVGQRTGSIAINDNAAGSPQLISLQGTGLGAAVSLSSTSIAFPSTPVGSSSTLQTLTLTNQGTATLTVTGVQIAGDFAQTNNCGGSLGAGSSCSVQVVFSPKATGSRSGSVLLTDSTSNSPQTVALSGTGSDFAISSSSSSATIGAGSIATYSLNVSSVGGAFSNQVTLACGQVPAEASCKVSSSTVTPGAKGATVTVTITTAGSSASTNRNAQDRPLRYAAFIEFQSFGLFGTILIGAKRNRKNWRSILALVVLTPVLLLAVGCAGGTGIAQQNIVTGTPAGTYTVVVAGTSGSLNHAVSLQLVVQ